MCKLLFPVSYQQKVMNQLITLLLLFTCSITSASAQETAGTQKSNLFLNGIYLDDLQILIPWNAEVPDLEKYGRPTIDTISRKTLNVLWSSVKILQGINVTLKYNPRRISRKGEYSRLSSIYGFIDTSNVEKALQIFRAYSNHSPTIRSKGKVTTYSWHFDGCLVSLSKGPYIGLLFIQTSRKAM